MNDRKDRPEELAAAERRAYDEFMAPGPLPPGADAAAAEAHLLETLEREIGVRIHESPRPDVARAESRVLAPADDRPGGPFAWLFGPRARPAFAFAAVIVAAVAVWSLVGPPGGERAPQVRGPGESATAAMRLSVEPLGGGRARLSWSATPGATRHAIVFLGDDLSELVRVDDVAGDELVLDAAALPAGLVSGRVVLWRVTAYAGRDEIARSATSPVAVP